MEKMKAILCPKYGAADILTFAQVNKPVPKDDEILIRIYSTSVTNSDLFIRSSKLFSKLLLIPFRLMMGIRGPRNPIIGEVFSGVIEAVGTGIRRFKPGDRVYGLTGFSLGAYADYKCMKERDSKQGCVSLMPETTDFNDATAAAYGGLLALQFMESAGIAPDSKVLIYGASGTTGTIALQFAKHLGAEVTAVCGPNNIDFVRSLKADKVIDYTRADSVDSLGNYDFILDAVGKAKSSALKKACRKALTSNGSYASIDDKALLLQSDRLDRITKLVESGDLIPVTGKIFAFEQIVEAHRYAESGHKRGNIAVTVNTEA